eukprot:343781-Prymnesium_polylepis.1
MPHCSAQEHAHMCARITQRRRCAPEAHPVASCGTIHTQKMKKEHICSHTAMVARPACATRRDKGASCAIDHSRALTRPEARQKLTLARPHSFPAPPKVCLHRAAGISRRTKPLRRKTLAPRLPQCRAARTAAPARSG